MSSRCARGASTCLASRDMHAQWDDAPSWAPVERGEAVVRAEGTEAASKVAVKAEATEVVTVEAMETARWRRRGRALDSSLLQVSVQRGRARTASPERRTLRARRPWATWRLHSPPTRPGRSSTRPGVFITEKSLAKGEPNMSVEAIGLSSTWLEFRSETGFLSTFLQAHEGMRFSSSSRSCSTCGTSLPSPHSQPPPDLRYQPLAAAHSSAHHHGR